VEHGIPRPAERALATSEPPFSVIVVPIDFSPASLAALSVAVSLGRTGASRLVLVSAVERPLYPDVAYANIPAAVEEERRDRSARLAGLAEETPRARAVVREGAAREQIVACARDEHADLIVIGAHGRHGLEHWLRGSVVGHVVREAPCHVLVVKHGERR